MNGREPPIAPYGELRVRLPNFVIIALRELVRDANERAGPLAEKWTVSKLLESWLLESWLLEIITEENMRKAADRSPEFKREAVAWIRWEAWRNRKRQH
ncbi:MAG TPA: hypothetical protein VMU84_07035 [Thermoanaerobaculia bacterium]|nr:hypothetical protein [Thermoanaerobaculia bacterium]